MKISGISYNSAIRCNFGADLHINGKKASVTGLKKLLKENAKDAFINSDDISDKRVTYYSHGKRIASETEYDKSGKWYKQTWYDYNDGKPNWVRFADGTLNLSRNGGKEWKKMPKVEFNKETDNKTLRLHVALPDYDDKNSVGAYSLQIFDKNGDRFIDSCVYLTADKQYCYYFDKGLKELQNELEKLKVLLLEDEYKDSFGASRLFNKNLEDVIKFLSGINNKA